MYINKRELGYILAKLEELHEDVREMKTYRAGVVGRVESLERSRAYFKGIGATIVLSFTAIMKYLYSITGH